MYSREEKIEFLEALHESGMTASEAERRPGWPSRATLRLWMKQLEKGELSINPKIPKGHSGDRKQHERYSDETKARAVRLYDQGRRPAAIAKMLGITCAANIRVWWKKTKEEGRLPYDTFEAKPYAVSKEIPVKKRKSFPLRLQHSVKLNLKTPVSGRCWPT
jgi:transposase-like protein